MKRRKLNRNKVKNLMKITINAGNEMHSMEFQEYFESFYYNLLFDFLVVLNFELVFESNPNN